MKTRERRGVALILVLSLLIVLGLVTAEVASRARGEGQMIIAVKSRVAARYAAESGILMARSAIQGLVTAGSATQGPEGSTALAHLDSLDRTLHHIPVGLAAFDVAILDLNARIDLNRSSETTLRRLFAEFIPAGQAAAVAANLKHEPISRLGELARVPGADDSLASAVAPYVTVFGDGIININAAPEPVLAALPGIGPAVAHTIVARRDAGETFDSPDQFRPRVTGPVSLDGFPAMTIAPSRVMIVSRGWMVGSPAVHEIQAVYFVVGGRLVLQNWEERDR